MANKMYWKISNTSNFVRKKQLVICLVKCAGTFPAIPANSESVRTTDTKEKGPKIFRTLLSNYLYTHSDGYLSIVGSSNSILFDT